MAALFVWFLLQISLNFLESTNYSCLSNSTCGCSLKPAILTKIVGGEPAGDDTWGWAVSIRSKNKHFCGGSLISDSLVLTAAHCFALKDSMSDVSVTAGSGRLSVIQQQRSISKVYIHRYYGIATYRNDIAVLSLSKPFNMTNSPLALICLPTGTIENQTNDTNVVAIGWGTLHALDVALSETLQQVTLKKVANKDSTCERTIHDTLVQFCAGVSDSKKDTCQGDSGGPLMMFSNNRWYLLGITSYGIGCARPGYAGVYTRVSAYDEVLNQFLTNNLSGITDTFYVRNSVSSSYASIYSNIFFIFFIMIFI